MWQKGGGAKQSTRRGGHSLTEDSQTEQERQRSVYTSSSIMLTTNSSNDEKKFLSNIRAEDINTKVMNIHISLKSCCFVRNAVANYNTFAESCPKPE